MSAWLAAATAPDVDGPITATTLESEMNFCASDERLAGPFSTGVSPCDELHLEPVLLRRAS